MGVPKHDFLAAQAMVNEFTPYDLELYGAPGRNLWEFRANDEDVLALVKVWAVESDHKALWAAFILESGEGCPSPNPFGDPATMFEATGHSQTTLSSMTHEFTGWTQYLALQLTFPDRRPFEAPLVTT